MPRSATPLNAIVRSEFSRRQSRWAFAEFVRARGPLDDAIWGNPKRATVFSL